MQIKKVIQAIVILGVIAAAIVTFRVPIGNVVIELENRFLPCRTPIPYSIDSFDTRFGISQNNFMGAIREAEQIWEKPIEKQLFAYTPDGSLKINLVYDSRQDATVKLQKLGITVDENRASFDALKAKYEALVAEYAMDKAVFESRTAAFQTAQNTYNAEVEKWNKRGGAPKDVYARLNEEQNALHTEAEAIRTLQAALNAKADEINAMAVVLNRLAATLNIAVAQFNKIGSTHGGEFEEGSYQSGPTGQEIHIYQFDNRAKLIRVLAHELGHALGLEHLEDPKAIMYRLNNGVNEKLTADDLAALKERCGIKQ